MAAVGTDAAELFEIAGFCFFYELCALCNQLFIELGFGDFALFLFIADAATDQNLEFGLVAYGMEK